MQTYSPINNPLISYQFPEIKEILLKNLPYPNYFNRYNIVDEYRCVFKNWIQSGTTSHIIGLDEFPYVYVINGVSQYINDLPKLEKRTIVLHEKEYNAYHKILKLYNHSVRIEKSYKNMDKGLTDEVIILSYPVSLNGNKDIDAEYLIQNSSTPIILDGVFLGSNLFNVSMNLSNVEAFLFSFSKVFGLAYNRIGIIFSKKQIEEYDLYHVYGYHNLFSAQIAIEIMKSYNLDYFTTKYKCVYEKACEQKNVDFGDCILVGKSKSQTQDKKALITDIFDDILNDLRKN